jgi:PAS domain S-box-containing protein
MRTHGYLAFFVGMCLTIWTCLFVLDAQDEQIRRNFQRDVDKVVTDTNVRLQTYFDMLLSLKGMFAVHQDVNRQQFAHFVRELNLTARYPGFQAIQFVRRLEDRELERFSASVRRDTSIEPGGYPRFAVHPAAERDEHFVVEYNEPMKGNENAFGLDLAALAPHLRAIEMGRESGQIVATERVTLVQDAGRQAGFVARAPVYRAGMPTDTPAQRRAALIGMVAIVFRAGNLMREVVEPSMLAQLSLKVHDAGNVVDGARAPATLENTMFDSGAAPARAVTGLTVATRLNVAQRQWVMQFDALGGGRYSRDYWRIALVAAAGLVISALIGALLLASSRSRLLASQLGVALDEQRAFQDSASVGIAMFSGGIITRCNHGLEELMGYAAGELAGKPHQLLACPAGDSAVDPFRVPEGSVRWQGEHELVRKDGSRIWCLIHGKAAGKEPLTHGGVWVIQDISDRKQTEAALSDAKSGLERSLHELAREKSNVEAAHSDLSAVLQTLQQAQQNLITAEKMASLGALVAGIAHELNTPIGNCLLTATALQEMALDFEKKLADGGIKRSALEAHLGEIRLACGIMSGSLRRAADLITSFKQVAVDQTSDQRRKFDLAEVVHDTLATYAARLRRANCEVNIDATAGVALDSYPGSVGQVLSNLLNNALLHAFEGRATAHIGVTAHEIDAHSVRIVFSDDGIGMPAKVLHQVFDPFFTTKMGQGGSGLGMNIVYNIVTGMLGGSIAIDSTPERGTAVTITIPKLAPRHENNGAGMNLRVAAPATSPTTAG